MDFLLTTPKDDDRPVYITGNFVYWDPKSRFFKMEEQGDGHYKITIDEQLLPEQIEFKFTRGGWENVELDKYGNITPNRKTTKNKQLVKANVPKWRFNWEPFKEEFFPIVELLDEEFYIPQLDKTRKIWALLPPNYYRTKRSFPVLYLQDAQNLFREGSEYGNWEIDKKLSILSEYGRGNVIIIAIEHGGEDRLKEYVLRNPKLTQNAEGKKYVRFITDTLKPYVDAHYRTKKDRENTGIGGSSLGALISIYAGFLYPEVYSRLMLFSPSLWVEPENNFPTVKFQHKFKDRVYLYGGKKEGAEMIKRIQIFENEMKKWEKQDLFDFEVKIGINEEGEHQEFYWSQEFPKAIEWLSFDSKQDPTDIVKRANIEDIYDV